MWSSGTQNPTQTKNDHIFATKEWELLYPTAVFRLPARWSLTIAQWFSLVHHFKKYTEDLGLKPTGCTCLT
jgi:hypothetical protein